jgi:hypothetical protein
MERLFGWLAGLGMDFFDARQDALASIVDMTGALVKRRGRCVKMGAEERDRRLFQLSVVYDMLVDMGLPLDQAETLLTILCTDENVTASEKHEMVRLYKEHVQLRPFFEGETVLPIPGAQRALRTAFDEKYVRFMCAVHKLLPVNVHMAPLEDALMTAVELDDVALAKAGLMQATGFTSTAEARTPHRSRQAAGISKESCAATTPTKPIRREDETDDVYNTDAIRSQRSRSHQHQHHQKHGVGVGDRKRLEEALFA